MLEAVGKARRLCVHLVGQTVTISLHHQMLEYRSMHFSELFQETLEVLRNLETSYILICFNLELPNKKFL